MQAPPPPKLSPRQLDVTRLVADGLTNEEIGALLYVTAPTVRVHLQHACERLGARNRTHLVALAIRAGLIP